MKILIVEDEPKVGKALSEGLKANGDEVTLAQTGEDGFFLASSRSFDLIVLDVMLPGRNGIEVLKTLRKQGLRVPVLLLTAKDSIEDRVLGLDAGADDYLVKPFAFPELRARLRALVRRGKTESLMSLKLGPLEMDLTKRLVTRNAKPIELTVREFELLEFLLRNKGRVVSREMLAKEIDGTAFRLMGTGVSALRPGSLADDTDMLDRRSAHAERAIDDLRKKFGNAAVIRGIAYDGPEK